MLGLATIWDLETRMENMQDKLDLVQNSGEKNNDYLKGKLQAFGLAVTETEKNYEKFQNITCENIVDLGVAIIKESMKNEVFQKLQQIQNIREGCLNGRVPNQVSDEEISNVCQSFMKPELCLKLGAKKLREITKCRSGNLYLTMDSVLYESFMIFPNIIDSRIYDVQPMPILIEKQEMMLNLGDAKILVEDNDQHFLGTQCVTEDQIQICMPSSLYGAAFNCLEEIITNRTITDCRFSKVNNNDCFMQNVKVGFHGRHLYVMLVRYTRLVRQNKYESCLSV